MGLISDIHCAYVRVVTWRHFQCPAAKTTVTTHDKLYVNVFPLQFFQSVFTHALLTFTTSRCQQ